MAAEMKVPDAVVDLVLSSYLIDWDQCNESTRDAHRNIMRAALEAALAAMLEPVGYLHVGLRQTDLLTARDFDRSEEKLTKWAATVGAPTAYRIKPE